MIKTFTQDELIQYVYDELPNDIKTKLERALIVDSELAEQCADLLATKRNLDCLVQPPSQRCISNILIYSQTLRMQS